MHTTALPSSVAPKDRRLLKGTIIGIAGLGLLVGGGTFAVWYQSDGIDGGDVDSGALSFTLANAAWENQAGTIADPANYQIVPGDTLTLTQDVNIVAVGDTLIADFSMDASGITPTNDLSDALDIEMNIATPPTGMAETPAGSGTYRITRSTFNPTQSQTPVPVEVAVTIDFPETQVGGADWGQIAQNLVVDLGQIEFELRQVVS